MLHLSLMARSSMAPLAACSDGTVPGAGYGVPRVAVWDPVYSTRYSQSGTSKAEPVRDRASTMRPDNNIRPEAV